MLRVLFGSRNPSKLARMQALLADVGVELVGLANPDAAEPDEGDCVETNARVKAASYAAAAGMPCIANDYGLRLDGLPDADQPAAYVRRLPGGGGSASDAEMMDFYVERIRTLGGSTRGTWTGALAIAFSPGEVVSMVAEHSRRFVSQPSSVALPGEPLASLQIDAATGRYLSEVGFEHRARAPSPIDAEFLKFVAQHTPGLRRASSSRPTPRERFLELALRNPVNAALLERLPALGLPDWHLVAGCLFQTVWNVLSGLPPTQGIEDYDVFYFDDRDLSWGAEDEAIRRCADAFADIDAAVQVRNQARVHLWYPQKYGVRCEPLESSRDGIDAFLNQSSCFGVRMEAGGPLDVYAPFGYEDLFRMVVRPNPRRFVPDVYYAKAQRWQSVWPTLTVLPWPSRADSG